MSNNVFYLLNSIRLSPSALSSGPNGSLQAVVPGSVLFNIDKAQRHHYSMLDVGRSMFDVQSFYCFSLMWFHTRLQRADFVVIVLVLVLVLVLGDQNFIEDEEEHESE